METSPSCDDEFNDLDTPIPEGLPEPATYRLIVMPLKAKKKIGNILLPDIAVDAEQWNTLTCRVAAVGPLAYKHPRYKEMGASEDDFPKEGDIIMVTTKSPMRFRFKGVNLVVINDDQYFARLPGDYDPSDFGFLYG